MIADRDIDESLLLDLMEGDAREFLEPQCEKQGWTIQEYAHKLATQGTIAYSIIDDKMSGYVIGFTSDPRYTTSFITQVFVNRKYRGLHIASKLMKEYEDYCIRKGLEGIWLTTQVDNYAAQKLYESLDFVKEGFADIDKHLYKYSKSLMMVKMSYPLYLLQP